ncbi:MAG: hypothetical protein ACJZ7A_01140 [Opitutales bacterium]
MANNLVGQAARMSHAGPVDPNLAKSNGWKAHFQNQEKSGSVGVYWMQDQQDVKFPKEWSMEVRNGNTWKPFELYVTRPLRQSGEPVQCDTPSRPSYL